MFVIDSTDSKYIGMELKNFKRGDTIKLDDGFEFPIQYIFQLDNGNTKLVSPNYQLELEETK